MHQRGKYGLKQLTLQRYWGLETVTSVFGSAAKVAMSDMSTRADRDFAAAAHLTV